MNSKPAVRLIYSLILNTIFLLIALLVFKPFFEEIDDTHIAMISEGAYGIREWHLIYPNVILGRLYVFLSSALPMIRWHVVIQYLFIFLAYSALCYVLCKHKHGFILAFFAVSATFYELYVSLQYTKTASFICAVSFLLVFQYVRNHRKLENIDSSVSKKYVGTNESAVLLKRENAFFIIFTFIFSIYGVMLRKESFFIACVPMAFLGVLELYRTGFFMKYLKILLPMFVLAIALILIDSYVYSVSPEWESFMQYNKARSEFTDYRHDLLYYKEQGDKLTEVGVSENDAVVILTYQFGDDNVFSYERLKEIRDAFPKHKAISVKLFRMLYGNVRDEVKRPNVILYAMLLLAVILIVSIVIERSKSNADYIFESRAKCIAMLLIGVLCALALFYFHYSGRWSHRLVASLVIPAILAISYMLDNEFIENSGQTIIFAGNKKDITGQLLIIAAVITVCLNVFMYFSSEKAYNEYVSDEAVNESIEAVQFIKNENKAGKGREKLYVSDTFTFQNTFKYDIFKPSALRELENFVTCGSWFMNSPVTKRVTRKFGYGNPYDALLSCSENVLLLDNDWADNKLEFLREHYDSRYEFEVTDAVPGVTAYLVR